MPETQPLQTMSAAMASSPEDFLASKVQAPLFGAIGIVGVGLIGSSLAKVIRQRGLARTIIACDQSVEVISAAHSLQLADAYTCSLAACAKEADFLLLCAPVGAFEAIIKACAPHFKKGALVSDVGSVKMRVMESVLPHLPEGVHFVPAHPVAGTENSGPEAGFASLFFNRWCILTPAPDCPQTATDAVRQFWLEAGSNVEIMDGRHHDLVLAITSHIPHLIAYNIVGTAADLEDVTQSEVIKFSAGGFRDFTRIAASDPTMWRDVFLNNKEAVLEMLGRFNEDLSALARMIRWDDGDGLHALFSRTRGIRRSIIAQGQETSATNFGRTP